MGRASISLALPSCERTFTVRSGPAQRSPGPREQRSLWPRARPSRWARTCPARSSAPGLDWSRLGPAPSCGWTSRPVPPRRAAHDTTVLALPALDVMTVAHVIDFVSPVFNEELDLARNVSRLHAYLVHEFPFSARITIADNASTDGTWFIARQLARDIPNVRPLHINEKGRGRALASAWLTSDARVVAYMDVDLSTDLTALLP